MFSRKTSKYKRRVRVKLPREHLMRRQHQEPCVFTCPGRATAILIEDGVPTEGCVFNGRSLGSIQIGRIVLSLSPHTQLYTHMHAHNILHRRPSTIALWVSAYLYWSNTVTGYACPVHSPMCIRMKLTVGSGKASVLSMSVAPF